MPLYQVSRRELEINPNTMAQAFDEVTFWRGDLYAERSILALVGKTTPLRSIPRRSPLSGAP